MGANTELARQRTVDQLMTRISELQHQVSQLRHERDDALAFIVQISKERDHLNDVLERSIRALDTIAEMIEGHSKSKEDLT